jgi:hypothetical protein
MFFVDAFGSCLCDLEHLDVPSPMNAAARIDFVCKYCGKPKGDAEDWLLAFEGTREKQIVMKYTISLLGKWDDERATEPNALYFCSTVCQYRYLWERYGDETWPP